MDAPHPDIEFKATAEVKRQTDISELAHQSGAEPGGHTTQPTQVETLPTLTPKAHCKAPPKPAFDELHFARFCEKSS